jgi:tRNA G10  N-methylase Trm11
MSSYFFLLGNTPELSLLELRSLLGDDVTPITEELAHVEIKDDETAKAIFKKTGGTVKLVKQIKEISEDEEESLKEIASYLVDRKLEGKLTFGLGLLGETSLEISETQIKKSIKKHFDLPSRFIEHIKTGLSAAVLLHQNDVIEVDVIGSLDKIYLGETIDVQDIDDWTKRDRRKPYADSKKGMLPPKVARMMVNIGTGNTSKTIYDPFCGTGTVLLEGLMIGHNVIGSDIDGRATAGAEHNIQWLRDQYDGIDGESKLYFTDATQVAKLTELRENPVDVIITEPFLGKPKPKYKELNNVFKGLEKMYLGAFKAFREVLKGGGKIVIIFPMVETPKKTFDLAKLIDKLEQLGYTTTSDPVVYARFGAVVQRQIYVFTLNKK